MSPASEIRRDKRGSAERPDDGDPLGNVHSVTRTTSGNPQHSHHVIARADDLLGRRKSGDLVEPARLHVVDEPPHLILPGDEGAFPDALDGVAHITF
jgi:hypothetical protein